MPLEVPYQAEDRRTYVPNFLNNHELADDWAEDGCPDGDRPFCTAELLPLTSRDLNKVQRRALRGIRHQDEGFDRAEQVNRRVFSKYAPFIDGLIIAGLDGTKHRPTTGAELWELGENGGPWIRDILIEDILKALKDVSRASEGDLGKWRLRSAGKKPETETTPPPKSGDARGAIPNTNTILQG